MNKKIIIIILCCIAFLLFIIIVYRENIFRLKLSTRLNYHEDVAYILIGGDRFPKTMDENRIFDVKIDDREDIEKIINYLNSLELIEDNPTEYTEYVPFDRNEVGYFTIGIIRDENDSDAWDWIVFETNYLDFIPNGHDWKGTRYYIKNSGYNSETQSSKTFQFLYDIINK